MDWQKEVSTAWGVTVRGVRGRGGAAEVHEGFQEDLDRRVALKVILSSSSSPEVHARFRREARTVAGLVHPNIVPVFNFGVFGPAMVIMMPWYETSLADAIRTHPLPVAQGRRLFEDIQAALAHAHSRGVVHRDVKPSNIMIDAGGHFVLADFGIAAVQDQTQLTRTGAVPGTPDYLAPEVITGEPPGPAADLYALGATLFEAVSGTRPFPSDNPVATAYQHVHGSVPPLTVPEDPQLAETIARLMSKDPKERSEGPLPEPGRPRNNVAAWAIGLGVAGIALIGVLVVLSFLGGSGDPVIHEQLLRGRFVSVDPSDLTGCPRAADRLSMGAPGQVARVSRIVQWALTPAPHAELRLEFEGRQVDVELRGSDGRAAARATVPGDLEGTEGSLTYLDSEGQLHRHRVALPAPLRWAELSALQRGTSRTDLARATRVLQDGEFEAGTFLASPGDLPIGPGGNASVVVSAPRNAEFAYIGAVIDEGAAIGAPRIAAEALSGTAYARLCASEPCGQAQSSDLVELVSSSSPARSALLDPPVGAQVLRFVWPAGSDGRDTRLHEVCALTLPAAG